MKYFGLIIGDLVPSDDSHWELYLTLRAIIDILNAKSFSLQEVEYLQCLVTEHHEIYIRLFDNTLKRKHHNVALPTTYASCRTFSKSLVHAFRGKT